MAENISDGDHDIWDLSNILRAVKNKESHVATQMDLEKLLNNSTTIKLQNPF